MKTLFLKDSVLFISKNGKEYEVSNPEILFIDDKIPEDEQQLFLAHCLLNGTKWLGEVELIKQQRLKSIGAWGSLGHFSIPDSDKNEFEFRTVARLLPKEKKEPTNYSTDPVIVKIGDGLEFVGPDPYMLGGIPDKGAMSHTESDYKQFEEPERCGGVRCQVGHTCFEDCSIDTQLQRITDLESDNKLLREENTKCKDLAWEAANEISRLNKEIERLKEQAEKLSFTKCDYCGYEKDLDV